MAATFTVETGAGLAAANAFITVAELDQYNDDNDNEPTVDKADTPRKQKAIRLATAKIVRDSVNRWRGSRWTEDQALPMPRTDIRDQDGYYIKSGSNTSLPQMLKDATAELTVAWLNGDRFDAAFSPEIESLSYSNEEKSESVGYRGAGRAATTKSYPKVARLLRPLLHSGGLVEPG
jgi:hypothetical protein